ncbi:helix-turn-helix transcriptional regulator [Pseudofulvibacter geojedonensis]|uniref:Helix-turn-helix transcriptional regulator n=1 Tax=Pseudofulvibacter geojedonensis TaxID=1123758 RepID=A0ABW3HZ15_9FLAO
MSITIVNYVTALVCIITAFVIHRIYYKEQKRDASLTSLQGIKWFGLAIFSWGLGALINIVLIHIVGLQTNDKILVSCGVFFSLLNSLFILMSLPSIEHRGKRNLAIQIIQRFSEKEVFIIFGGILVMLASVFVLSFSTNTNASSNSVIWLIDIPISLIVAFALLNELNKAFRNRGMRFMYLPTIALFLLILIAVIHRIVPSHMAEQIMNIESWSLIGVITALSFKFLFVLLFTILLYSWKLLAEKEEQQTELAQLKISLTELKKDKAILKIANESHLDTIKHLKVEISKRKKKYKQLKKSAKVELSDRQKEVLANLGVCGSVMSYTEMANAMHISVDGFQAHIYQIKKVLNISGSGGKKQLIQYAINNDLLKFATIDKK